MPYIGQKGPGSYQATKAVQRFNGDGSDTTFTLTTTVSSVQDVLVSFDGVVQDVGRHDPAPEEEDDGVMGVPRCTAPRYPSSKTEGWWVVLGRKNKNELLGEEQGGPGGLQTI